MTSSIPAYASFENPIRFYTVPYKERGAQRTSCLNIPRVEKSLDNILIGATTCLSVMTVYLAARPNTQSAHPALLLSHLFLISSNPGTVFLGTSMAWTSSAGFGSLFGL